MTFPPAAAVRPAKAETSVFRTILAWWLAWPVMLLVLLAPALWNGFPLIFADTGGHLARPFEHTLALGRSAFYGAFLAAGIPLDFWPNVLVQAALTVWLIVLSLRAHGCDGRPGLALLTVIGLAVLTSLAWFVGQLMPDILLPLAALGLHLLAFRSAALRPLEVVALIAVIAAAIASHMAILGLSLVLIAAYAALALAKPIGKFMHWPRPAPLYPAAATAVGAALALVSNFAITGQFAFTPGGETFLFGRLIQDGIISRYLAEHCPQASTALCPYRAQLSSVADDWLWANDSPLHKVGGAQAFAPEERRIIGETLVLYPGMHLAAASRATLGQLHTMRTVVSTDPGDNADAREQIEHLAPGTLPRFYAARQQRATLDIDALNLVHVPVAALSMAGLIVIVTLGHYRRVEPATAALAASVLIAILANAAICGVFSKASDRYQSRLVWLAPFCVGLAVFRASCRNAGARLPQQDATNL
ncbi:MAG: hypothetical protein ACLPKB_27320 [Xanthobacteraceae bacterium]